MVELMVFKANSGGYEHQKYCWEDLRENRCGIGAGIRHPVNHRQLRQPHQSWSKFRLFQRDSRPGTGLYGIEYLPRRSWRG